METEFDAHPQVGADAIAYLPGDPPVEIAPIFKVLLVDFQDLGDVHHRHTGSTEQADFVLFW